jgi:hypothetical protein
LISGATPFLSISWAFHIALGLVGSNIGATDQAAIPTFNTIFNPKILGSGCEGFASTQLKGHRVISIKRIQGAAVDVVSVTA